jgi:hypothetical protein
MILDEGLWVAARAFEQAESSIRFAVVLTEIFVS